MHETPCPCCGVPLGAPFYAVDDVPVHSVLLFHSREEAVAYPRGDIRLAACRRCGFITNTAFDPGRHEYSGRYEETQGFSPTFSAFHRRLAEMLIRRHDLRGKEIIEIGCGKGEFLALLCELGDNRGLGFDPAYVPGRVTSERATFIADFYSAEYAHHRADFICCKMTLEHIPDVASFVGTVRRAVAAHPQTLIFFQVPDVARILRDSAFWDIYYEHCSYFSIQSVGYLFRQAGFEVVDLWRDYDDQYLMITARPGAVDRTPPALTALEGELARFRDLTPPRLAAWRARLAALRGEGRRVVLWGGGSKAVAFLTTLGVERDTISHVVDINPYKAGTFLPPFGQEVVAPAFLREYQPDLVLVMNAVYIPEIRRSLAELGLSPDLAAVQ